MTVANPAGCFAFPSVLTESGIRRGSQGPRFKKTIFHNQRWPSNRVLVTGVTTPRVGCGEVLYKGMGGLFCYILPLALCSFCLLIGIHALASVQEPPYQHEDPSYTLMTVAPKAQVPHVSAALVRKTVFFLLTLMRPQVLGPRGESTDSQTSFYGSPPPFPPSHALATRLSASLHPVLPSGSCSVLCPRFTAISL